MVEASCLHVAVEDARHKKMLHATHNDAMLTHERTVGVLQAFFLLWYSNDFFFFFSFLLKSWFCIVKDT